MGVLPILWKKFSLSIISSLHQQISISPAIFSMVTGYILVGHSFIFHFYITESILPENPRKEKRPRLSIMSRNFHDPTERYFICHLIQGEDTVPVSW